MPRAIWPLHRGRPRLEVVLNTLSGMLLSPRNLVADSGAGSMQAPFELILTDQDCLASNATLTTTIQLGGAFSGAFPLYSLRIQVPQIGFDRILQVVGVPIVLTGFDGLAGFRFLNRFTYGNFGDPDQFGLEV